MQTKPLTQYLISLTATAVAFCLYWLLAVPWLEPTRLAVSPPRTTTASNSIALDGDKSLLASLLPENTWELQPCKILETSQGTIYFRDYETFPDGTIEVYPFTMLIRSESLSLRDRATPTGTDATARRPIVLRASQRASLQFDAPLVLGAKSPGKLQSGQLKGLVHVFQPHSAPEKQDGFSLWTSNVQMTPLKIFSLDDVDFQLGPHQGSGRSFTIDLSHNTPLEAINTDFAKINGIKRLELAFLKSLQIKPQAVPARPAGADGSTNSLVSRSFSSDSGPLDVTCAGPFVFDFDKLVASFEQDVLVQRALEPGDAIRGKRLEVRFDREFNPQESIPQADERPDLSRLKVRSIHVLGQPAKMHLVSQQIEITASELEYDLSRQQVFARDPQQVQVNQPQQQFQAREIQYRLRDDRSLGPLLAEGPGRIVSTSKKTSGPQQVVIRWNGRLTVEPDEQQRLITLSDGASITLDNGQQLAGDRLRLWLWMQPGRDSANSDRWAYLPIQAEVDGRVVVNHADFAGLAHRLTAKWPLADQLEQQQIQMFRSAERVASLSTTPLKPPTPLYQAQQPDAALRFASQEILVRLDQTDKITELQSVRLDGEVQVDHWDFAQPQQQPTSLTGGRLHIKPLSEQLYHLAVVDNAHVVAADWNLSGPELHYDQQANRIWVNGGGQAAVQDKKTANQTIDITWKAGMIFDGEKLYFENQVVADIRQPAANGQGHSHLQSRSEALSLILDQPIKLDELRTVPGAQTVGAAMANAPPGGAVPGGATRLGSSTSVRQLILVNQLLADQRVFPATTRPDINAAPPVVLVRQLYDAQKTLQLKQTLIAPYLEISPKSEQIAGSGPGQIIQWQRQLPGDKSGRPSLLSVSGPVQPSRTVPPGSVDLSRETAAVINYLHVLYDGTLNAKGQPAELRLQGRVRGLYGNVADFETEHNPDRKLTERGGQQKGLLKLSSDDLHVIQWQRRADEKAYWELIASGSANFVGESFEATAARMSYDERSGKLIIDGGDRGDAKLWYQSIPSNPQRDHLVAEQIHYWPDTQRAEIEKVRNATINRNPGGSR